MSERLGAVCEAAFAVVEPGSRTLRDGKNQSPWSDRRGTLGGTPSGLEVATLEQLAQRLSRQPTASHVMPRLNLLFVLRFECRC